MSGVNVSGELPLGASGLMPVDSDRPLLRLQCSVISSPRVIAVLVDQKSRIVGGSVRRAICEKLLKVVVAVSSSSSSVASSGTVIGRLPLGPDTTPVPPEIVIGTARGVSHSIMTVSPGDAAGGLKANFTI